MGSRPRASSTIDGLTEAAHSDEIAINLAAPSCTALLELGI